MEKKIPGIKVEHKFPSKISPALWEFNGTIKIFFAALSFIFSDTRTKNRAQNNFWTVAGHVDRPNQF